MKRMLTLVSLTLYLMGAIQPGLAEQVTLGELKLQTPNFMALELPGGEDGTPVAASIPVILPNTEGLHVQIMAPMVMDKAALLKAYTPVEDIPLGPDNHHEYFCFFRFAPKGKTKIFSDLQAGWKLYKDHQPDNNEMPWERPAEKLQEIIALCGWDADVRVLWQAATSQGYAVRDKLGTSSRGEAYVTMVFNERYPVKKYEKGYYQLHMSQYLDGACIFGSSFDGRVSLPKTGVAWEDSVRADCKTMRMNVLSEDDFGIFMELLETEQIISADVPLAPFEVIQKAIEARIGEGKLKTAYSMRLFSLPGRRPGKSGFRAKP